MLRIAEEGRTLNVGVLGLGSRGIPQLKVIHSMADVKVCAVCDVYEDRVQAGLEIAKDAVGTQDYREVLKMPQIEAVFIFTDWLSHIPIAIEAMKAGKEVAMEVGGAATVEDCWKLVRTAEETGRQCMLLENCSYGVDEMAVINMIRQGKFGEIVHCEGAYAHDLRDEIGNGDINRHYRQQNFLHRNAELYPTHELGPIAQYLRLGRGNRMVTLCSMASKAVGLHEWLQKNRPGTALADAQVNEGDIVTTLIKCANGETILLKHDCTLPRPYSRGGVVRGTKGIWQEDNHGIYIDGRSPHDPSDWMHHFEDDAPYMKEYEHPIWTAYHEIGERGGHGGMDFLVLRAFVESVQRNEQPPIDVYDAAAWMAITPLGEESIARGSIPVAVPDFTNGKWLLPRENATGTYALH